jgi:hypothetical protein
MLVAALAECLVCIGIQKLGGSKNILCFERRKASYTNPAFLRDFIRCYQSKNLIREIDTRTDRFKRDGRRHIYMRSNTPHPDMTNVLDDTAIWANFSCLYNYFLGSYWDANGDISLSLTIASQLQAVLWWYMTGVSETIHSNEGPLICIQYLSIDIRTRGKLMP